MKKKLMLGGGATAVAVAVGVLLAPLAAQAGHANTVLEADLNGRNEVAADGSKRIVGDPNGRGEAYVFGIDGDPNTLCYLIDVDKIDELDGAPNTGGRAAHIHEGAKGTNGPVVVGLAFPTGGQSADCLTVPEGGLDSAAEVADILSTPADYYVNVHNGVYPSGAIRGQLSVAD